MGYGCMSFIKEFKEFAVKGNAIDMAVGIVIGAAFGKIVSSFVSDIIMPPIGLILGGIDFTGLFINLSSTAYETLEAAKQAGAPTINYGSFIQSVVDFVIVAFAIFMAIKGMNSLRKEKEKPDEVSEPSDEVKILREIRDSLKK